MIWTIIILTLVHREKDVLHILHVLAVKEKAESTDWNRTKLKSGPLGPLHEDLADLITVNWS